jgi:hypothetical protein
MSFLNQFKKEVDLEMFYFQTTQYIWFEGAQHVLGGALLESLENFNPGFEGVISWTLTWGGTKNLKYFGQCQCKKSVHLIQYTHEKYIWLSRCLTKNEWWIINQRSGPGLVIIPHLDSGSHDWEVTVCSWWGFHATRWYISSLNIRKH